MAVLSVVDQSRFARAGYSGNASEQPGGQAQVHPLQIVAAGAVQAQNPPRARGRGFVRRLDEAPPGTGFGLSIVCDIAELYAGTVALEASENLGGLKVLIDLPVPIVTGR